MKYKRKKRLLLAALLALLVPGIWTGVSAWQSAVRLTVTEYAVTAGITEKIRVVHLTDLHGKHYGTGNEELVRLVVQQKPDLILMTGDMMDKSDENADTVCDLIRCLTQTAPVYVSYGNHEWEWMQAHGESLTPALSGAGATVLDTAYTDITVNGQELRIGGCHNYYRQPHMLTEDVSQQAVERAFCEEFEKTDRCKILLCHIPTPWLDWGYIDRYPVDLVLSGHYHGGQIRLPLAGGLYAPYIGLFPPYTRGLFTGQEARCVLSAGLGSGPGIPRIHNLPELVVIDLVPAEP